MNSRVDLRFMAMDITAFWISIDHVFQYLSVVYGLFKLWIYEIKLELELELEVELIIIILFTLLSSLSSF